MVLNKHYYKTALSKAKKSISKFKISALSLNKRGEILGITVNYPRFSNKGGGIHAEELAIRRYGPQIKTMFLLRTNISGKLLPIDPCIKCQKLIDRFNIKLIKIKDII